jgi:N-acetylmuramoyl-L-alanine amidase
VAGLSIHRNPIPYASSLQARSLDVIDLVVIHCTELPDLAEARDFGLRILYPESLTGNCGHYYIERSGQVEEWVAAERVAHHVRGYNERSMGIELVNRGRYPAWLDSRAQEMTEPYASAQIESLVLLLRELRDRLPRLRWIAGHETLDTGLVPASDDSARLVNRKRDPGPLFPWDRVLERVDLERFTV